MTHARSRQKVTKDVNSWNKAIQQAQDLLIQAEARAARLKGAIKTFTELRDCGHEFTGPDSAEKIVALTQSSSQPQEQQHSV